VREAFARQLAELEQRIDGELAHAIAALGEIADAVHDPSGEMIEAIAQSGQRLKRESHRIDADLVRITARQAPVASDLRLVLALVQLAHHEGLIANQFELISHQLAAIDPDVPDRYGTAEKLSTMATLAATQLHSAARAFTSRDLVLARGLDRQDDAIDKLNREIFETTLELDDAPERRELGLRHVLIARSLERIGDNAVDIAEQAAFLITAELREFTDASRPKQKR
jgi:phosphate transport system protein